MPSELPVYAARLRSEEFARMESLRERAEAATGVPLSRSDLLRLLMPLGEATYPAAAGPKKSPKKS